MIFFNMYCFFSNIFGHIEQNKVLHVILINSMVVLLLLVAVNNLMLCYLVLYSTMLENIHYYY